MVSDQRSIAVFTPLCNGFYFGGIISGIREVAAAAGFATVAYQTVPAGMRESDYWDAGPRTSSLGRSHSAGHVSILNVGNPQTLREISAAGRPLVLVSHDSDELSCPVAMPDNAGGVKQSVAHLIRHGHRRIAFAGAMSDQDIVERYEAYRQALLEHGIEPDPALFYECGSKGLTGGHQAAAAMLAAGLPSTAVVMGTDLNAVGLMDALKAAGLRLPRQQAVTGFDNGDHARHTRPGLSTVSQDFVGLGRLAAELVLAQIRGENVPRTHHHLATHFIRRQSCGCPSRTQGLDVEDGVVPLDPMVAPLLARATGDPASEPAPEPERDWAFAALSGAFLAALNSTSEDTEWALSEAAEQVWPHIRSLDDLTQATTFIRGAAAERLRAMASQRPDLTPGLTRRLETLLFQLNTDLASIRAREQFLDWRFLADSLVAQYDVSIDLLRSHDEGVAGLGWLVRSTAVAGLFALRVPAPDSDTLSVVSIYDPQNTWADRLAEVIDERDLPPMDLLRMALQQPKGVVIVIPVEGAGVRSGLLAVVAPVDNSEATGRETFHDWAAMLAVSLQHQEAVSALRRREADLRDSLDREQQLAAEIGRSEERYAVAAAAANDGLWDWELATGRTYFSDRALTVLGSDAALDHIDGWLGRVHPDDRAGLDAVIEQERAGGSEPLSFEHRVTTDDGAIRWVLCRGLGVLVDGTAARIIGSLTDVTQRRELEDRLRHQALYDSLTGLPNRVLLLDRLEIALHRARRRENYRFAVLFIDLNGFKKINDSLGHAAGDELLITVGHRLQAFVRAADTAARLGGDEFVVLLDDLGPDVDVPEIAARLHEELGLPIVIDSTQVAVSASIGICVGGIEELSAEDVLRAADLAMYESKSAGRA